MILPDATQRFSLTSVNPPANRCLTTTNLVNFLLPATRHTSSRWYVGPTHEHSWHDFNVYYSNPTFSFHFFTFQSMTRDQTKGRVDLSAASNTEL